MNIPVPQHGGRVGNAVQQLINNIVRLIALLIGWQIDSLANIAGFATVDDTRIPDGSSKFVRTVKDTFHLDKTSAAVVDNITVVATMSGDGRWIRDLQPNAVWGSQATWYVDPLTGNDENTGATALVPLATFAEARRRVEPIGVLVDMTIYIVSSLAATDLVGMNCGGKTLTIEGVPTVLQTGEVVAYSKDAAANNPGHLSDATWTVADVLHKHVLFTSGAAAGMGCWVMEDLGGGDSRVTTICNQVYGFPSTATPAPGDTFEVQEMPSVFYSSTFGYDGQLNIGYLDSELQNVFPGVHFGDGAGGKTHILSCRMYYLRSSTELRAVDNLITRAYNLDSYLEFTGGACRTLSMSFGGIVLVNGRELTLDAGIPGVASGLFLCSVDKHSMFDSNTDVYLFGTVDTAIALSGWCTFKLTDTKKLRGIITSSLLALVSQSTHLAVFDRDNTVTEKTVRLQPLGNLDIELDTDTPVYDPHWDIRIGDGDYQTAAIGSRVTGIKGAIGAVTVFALPDFTSSATDDLPIVVTNRSFARNLQCRLGTAPGGADTVIVTVHVNGVPTALTVTFGPADVTKSDVTHAVLVNPGDEVSFEVVSSGALAADLSMSLEAG